jgi:hypothetical protein
MDGVVFKLRAALVHSSALAIHFGADASCNFGQKISIFAGCILWVRHYVSFDSTIALLLCALKYLVIALVSSRRAPKPDINPVNAIPFACDEQAVSSLSFLLHFSSLKLCWPDGFCYGRALVTQDVSK